MTSQTHIIYADQDVLSANMKRIDLFSVVGGHIEFISFKEYYGMARGTRSCQYLGELFGQKENFSVYFSAKRQKLLHPNSPNTAQRSSFPITESFPEKVKEKPR